MNKKNRSNKTNFTEWYLPRKKVFDNDFLMFYEKIITPKQTKKEVEFILKILKPKPKAEIFDLACGWGRHTIEFAKHGHSVTGQDVTPFFLKIGARNALKERVRISWIKSDMRKIPFKNKFEIVLNLFTSFGYFEKESDHQKVFFEVAKSLKQKGYFLLDVINREKILHPYEPERILKAADGSSLIIKKRFDLAASRNNERRLLILKGKEKREFFVSIRIFTLTELISMAKKTGLIFKIAYGNYRGDPFSLDADRCIVVFQKRKG